MIELEFRDLPGPYKYFRFITGTAHMHFGLFADASTTPVQAQIAMMERLLGFFPSAVTRVLDIGTGLGGTACLLAQRGIDVTGIAPEEGLIDYARRLAESLELTDLTHFEATRFEDFPATVDPPFETVLSQESLQYLPDLDATFAHVRGVLSAGGRFVIGDQILRYPGASELWRFHESEAIKAAGEGAGFRLAHHEDVTDAAKPSSRFAVETLKAARPSILEHWKDDPETDAELREVLQLGLIEHELYLLGKLGYEIFVFEAP